MKWGIGAAIVLIAAAALGAYWFFGRPIAPPFQDFSITQLTTSGEVQTAAISPDGKYVLTVVMDKGQSSMWLRHVATNSDAQVIAPSDEYFNGISFSPDGNYLYFRKADTNVHDVYTLYRAPVLGGTPQPVVHDIDLNPTFSPDGKRIAYVRENDPVVGKYQVLISNDDGSGERVLSTGATSNGPLFVSWSPAENSVVETHLQVADNLTEMDKLEVPSGKSTVVLGLKNEAVFNGVWTPNGKGLLVVYAGPQNQYARNQIGYVSVRDGKFYEITKDTSNYFSISVSADGRNIASVQQKQLSGLYVFPASGTGKELPSPIFPQDKTGTVFDWDGNDSFYLPVNTTVFRTARDGKTQATLLENASVYDLSACSDSHTLVFSWIGGGGLNNIGLWRINSDGSNAVQLVTGKREDSAVCSPDSKWVYFRDLGSEQIYRVPLAGGQTEAVPGSQVEHGIVGSSVMGISPDGKMLAFLSTAELPGAGLTNVQKIVLVPLDAGSNPDVRRIDPNSKTSQGPRFTPDGKAVVYAIRDNGVDNLWEQPLDGAPGRQITDFKTEQIRVWHFSPDGKSIAMIRGHLESDAVLLHDNAGGK